jgi:hypothetical protein
MNQTLQNRVTPLGDIVAVSARGTMMGNRGGRLHDDNQRLGRRRWASRAWICCELHFKGRWRPVMGRGYTELFFLDEVTALAAGHRPCFECRRTDAKAFQAAFPGGRLRAWEMDRVLHAERLGKHQVACTVDLPDGAVWAVGGETFARREGRVLRWSFEGWHEMPGWQDSPARLLTPPSIVGALHSGYKPRWHISEGRSSDTATS